MKVTIWKNVDIEAEADVEIEDCINELLDIANSEDGPRRKILAIDGATKILERITPTQVEELLHINPGAVKLIRDRLAEWIKRMETA